MKGIHTFTISHADVIALVAQLIKQKYNMHVGTIHMEVIGAGGETTMKLGPNTGAMLNVLAETTTNEKI